MADTYGKAATWDIRTSLAATSPNVAIIDVGINNYIDNYSLEQGLASTVPCGLNPASLQRLWDAVVYYPGITGVVITTVEDAALPDGTDNVNAIVRKYVADRTAQGKNVCLGELPASFAGLTMPGDRYQLSAVGKDVVAAALVTPTLTAIAVATGIRSNVNSDSLACFHCDGRTAHLASYRHPDAAAIRFWKVVRSVFCWLSPGRDRRDVNREWVRMLIQLALPNQSSQTISYRRCVPHQLLPRQRILHRCRYSAVTLQPALWASPEGRRRIWPGDPFVTSTRSSPLCPEQSCRARITAPPKSRRFYSSPLETFPITRQRSNASWPAPR